MSSAFPFQCLSFLAWCVSVFISLLRWLPFPWSTEGSGPNVSPKPGCVSKLRVVHVWCYSSGRGVDRACVDGPPGVCSPCAHGLGPRSQRSRALLLSQDGCVGPARAALRVPSHAGSEQLCRQGRVFSSRRAGRPDPRVLRAGVLTREISNTVTVTQSHQRSECSVSPGLVFVYLLFPRHCHDCVWIIIFSAFSHSTLTVT